MRAVDSAGIAADGLQGDHARPGKRAVTLIQAEHLPVITALSGLDAVAPETLRRNIVVSGLNLTAARHRLLRVGSAVLRFSVPCAPCSRMEAALGPGGYNAMRGHGGWCMEVVEPGRVGLGDAVDVD
ncbi:MOSC domain-containing protein [Limimaricola cinnabarinus]|uniref:MOSC domain-containing protein n=1 Tax=Limimaricola cinnabarinus TaxID=1125964 RepID=UPI002FE0C070